MQLELVGGAMPVPKNLPRSEKRSILVGMILGDGHLRIGKRTSSLSMIHGVGQKEYIYFKKALLEFVLNQKLKVHFSEYFDQRTSKTYGRYTLWTQAHAYFKHLGKSFYQGKKKVITEEALTLLTPIGLALWYMDDGSMIIYKNQYVRTRPTPPKNAAPEFFLKGLMLSLYSTQEEAQLVQNFLKERWGVTFKLRRNRERYSLESNVTEAKKFIELIRPYIIPSMEYKIDLDKRVAWYKAAQAQ